MIMIKLDTAGTTTLLSATTTTESTVDNEEDAITTALTSATTLSSSFPSASAHAEMTQRYIDSLSETELIEMEQRLTQKENEMSIKINGEELTIETPKTYKKL